ncbi:MAG: metallophosphoesterase [Nitrosopumilaceae archaeon]
MLFSHISDTHLGLVQYNSEERENDIYDAFNQAIDISIKDHVDFVIFAGDIFHSPNPSGTAIMHMAHALKKLKQNSIDSFFVLGEHDISRIRSYPVPYVYHKLGFSQYIGEGKPAYFKDVLIIGFDKIRKSEMRDYESKFREVDKIANQHKGHKILVMHQGITEANKFAGEITTNDLPKNFTYYAMGHLHDKFLKSFGNLKGPIAYPGSIELTTSEGIKNTKKGFYQVDISGVEAKPEWIELNLRPQLSVNTSFENITRTIDDVLDQARKSTKKPIIEIRIEGTNIHTDIIQPQISRLIPHTLHCTWNISKHSTDSSVLIDKPLRIDDEMLKLAISSLKSEKIANFALKELLPALTSNDLDQATQIIFENFKQFKKEKQK